jgi:predicted transcriptional regulator
MKDQTRFDSLNALSFAEKNPGWNTFKVGCSRTLKAINSLKKKNLVETNEHGQYRLAGTISKS